MGRWERAFHKVYRRSIRFDDTDTRGCGSASDIHLHFAPGSPGMMGDSNSFYGLRGGSLGPYGREHRGLFRREARALSNSQK